MPECPEHDCALSLPREELLAHLRWDHNHSEFKAKEKLNGDV
jgi:hypothetical protein